MNCIGSTRAFLGMVQSSLCLAWIMSLLLGSLNAAETPAGVSKEAEALWQQIESLKRTNATPPTAIIRTNREAYTHWRLERASNSVALADLQQRFYSTFPGDSRASSAKRGELDSLRNARSAGLSNTVSRLEKAEQGFLMDTNSTMEERFRIRRGMLDRKLAQIGTANRKDYAAAVREGTRELMKEFPAKQEQLQQGLLRAVEQVGSIDGLAIAREVLNSSTGRVKQASETLVARLDRLGKPLELTLTNISGGTFSTTALKGKVIIIDFGATWSGAWKRELPALKKAYEEFHDQGLEIFGISLDNDPKKIEDFAKAEKLPWGFFCDGKAYRSEVILKLNAGNIPSRWLIDRKGTVRELNARGDLARLVAELIAEKP
jgi:peroxiredoxin